MTGHQRMTALIVAVLTAGALLMAVADYWARVERAPVEACPELDDEQLVADCLAGVSP